ncbi:MAG: SLATT domain-containing protein [Anaerolineae bacterium]
MDLETFDLVTNWKQQVNDLQKDSYALAIKHNRYHYWIGISAVLIGACVGVALLIEGVDLGLQASAGWLAILAAGLSAIQTFFNPGRRAEKHLSIVSRLVHVRRDIELFERLPPGRKAEREQRIREINESLSTINEDSPAAEIDSGRSKCSWLPLILAAGILLVGLIAIGNEWIKRIPATQQSEAYGIREAIQQGSEIWTFDANDPLLDHRIILVNTLINEMTSQKVISLLAYLNGQDHQAPITIYLSSTGGYIKDAYAIVNAMQGSSSVVNTLAIGDCYSACAKVLMGGTGMRSIFQNSRIMIHTHSYPYDEDPRSDNRILYDRETDFIRQYSDIPLDWIDRRENYYYLTPEQALLYHVVDEILK